MESELAPAVLLAASVLIAWLVPAAVLAGVLPLAARSGLTVSNYRGERLPVIGGIVWLAWSIGMMPVGVLVWAQPWRDGVATYAERGGLTAVPSGLFLTIASVAVLAAYCFGMIDDVYDTGEAKGLRGHLGMLASGRLSTGLLKLVGLGLVAATASGAWVLGRVAGPGASDFVGEEAARWFAGTVLIAASSNATNLLDLRPGRALKGYVLAVSMPLVYLAAHRFIFARHVPSLAWLALAVFVLGPVLAVWRFDLTEKAVLGDAGSNPMGVLAGLLWLAYTPLYAVVAVAVLTVALNLLAEKVSFSAVIENVGVLKWLDQLGRVRDLDDETT